MNSIKLKANLVSDYRIEYEYEIAGDWQKYFTNDKFYVEYSVPVKGINESIAIIPILGTVLPISWLFDAEIILNEIDKEFYESIPEFKKGYENMYPQLNFKGGISANKIVENEHLGDNVAALFSGGVDAFNTLITHINEGPDLITIWGADISVDNEDGWNVVLKHRDTVAEQWGLNGITVKSPFRNFIDEGKVSRYTLKAVNDSWWHGFHHSIGMFALTAPLAYAKGYSRLYVASSFTEEYKGKYTCASDPTIDNFVKFCECRVIHDGYEFNRQDKIKNICEYSAKNNMKIPLRVCWESTDGSNCCICEKCYRTMLGIYAEKKNPIDFGFDYIKTNISSPRKVLGPTFANVKTATMRYDCIQKRMRENYSKNEIDASLRWFYKTDIDILIKRFKQEYYFKGIILKTIRKIRKILK